MLKLRTDTRYVAQDGKMTQAGVEAIQGQIDASDAAITALDTRTDALEAIALRAFVNFNGVTTVTVRASFNIASVVRNSTGDYTITFTTPMVDANYVISLAYTGEVNVQHGVGFITSQAADSFNILFINPANAANTVDKSIVCISVFR